MSASVAISSRDRPKALERCLEALFRGSRRPTEVVLVDQSRTDETRSIVEGFAEIGVEIVYLRQSEPGLARSQNAAIRAARCEVIAVTDDDCVPSETWLEVVEAAFQSDADLGLLTGRVLPLPADSPDLVPVSTRTSDVPVDFSSIPDPWEIGSGNNFALRGDWFNRIGGCDERLGPGAPGRGAMDMDLFYRLARAGARVRYEPRAVVLHEQKPIAERLSRRPDYGFGMGACCALWRREGDRRALGLLGRWLRFRLGLLVRALGQRRLRTVREEAVMLRSTVAGLFYGALKAR
jgi:O-antigen biosynthesis protein